MRVTRRRLVGALGAGIAVAAGLAVLLTLAFRGGGPKAGAEGSAPVQEAEGFTLVGRNPLYHRGMNAALAVYDHFVFVGNRTDGSVGHLHSGVLVVDVADPANPEIVGEIGRPHAATVGRSTRELRVWPEEKLLIVMTIPCSAELHECSFSLDTTPFSLSFFDLADPRRPRYLSSYVPTSEAGAAVEPHEMFLWVDPSDPERALLWLSTPTESNSPEDPNLLIVDISDVPAGGGVRLVAGANWNDRFRSANGTLALHSMTPTADGKTTYLAYLGGTVLALDTSDVIEQRSEGRVISLDGSLVTDPDDRPAWQTPAAHSAVPVPGRSLVLVTDEVYGTYADPGGGCPWGWVHLLDFGTPGRPTVVGEFKLEENRETFCAPFTLDEETNRFASFASHNPTVLPTLAFVTWHAGGLQAIDIRDPSHPRSTGHFKPDPLEEVATEDPALSQGTQKVVMWSYPIVKDGLVYVIDVRNGLYILRYSGWGAKSVGRLALLEGNSNLGNAPALARQGQ